MIKLRLQRKGRKKRPFYHIVVADSRSPRDGRIIEMLGRFDNVSEKKELTYDEERIIHWLKIGAQPSNTVRSILKSEGILYKMHLMRWGKTDEEIEAALEAWRAEREVTVSDKESSRRVQQKELLKAEEKAYKQQIEEKAAKAAKELEKKKETQAKAAEAAEEEVAAETEDTAVEAEVAKDEAAEETATAETTQESVDEDKKEEIAAEIAEEEAPKDEVIEEPVAEAETTVDAEEKVAKVESEPVAEAEETAVEEPEAEVVAAEEPAIEEKVEEAKTEEEPKSETAAKEETDEASSPVSTDMTANEAIDHIKNTALEDLEGFVPEDEERVTVQRAWESKKTE